MTTPSLAELVAEMKAKGLWGEWLRSEVDDLASQTLMLAQVYRTAQFGEAASTPGTMTIVITMPDGWQWHITAPVTT